MLFEANIENINSKKANFLKKINRFLKKINIRQPNTSINAL